MEKLKAIIIDDEQPDRESLCQDLSKYFKNKIEVLVMCEDAIEGMKSINTLKPDLVFLDIKMAAN